MRANWRALPCILGVLISCIVAPGTTADTRLVPSADMLPAGSWVYDAVMNLAADGLIDGYAARTFAGDTLFSRLDIAHIIAPVVRRVGSDPAPTSSTALIGKLVEELRPEIAFVDPSSLEGWSQQPCCFSGSRVALAGYVRPEASNDTGDGGNSAIPYRISVFSDLSDRSFAIASVMHPQIAPGDRPDRLTVRGFSGDVSWQVGHDFLRWGPAYAGSLILSDNSGPFWSAGASKEFALGPFFGRVKITQFVSMFEDLGEKLYLLGRRYEGQIGHGWHIGVSETAKTSTTPNPLVLLLPFYLYQELFISVDAEFNTLYSADLLYDAGRGYQAYAELLIDDITSPRIFDPDRFERPRKTGWTVGVYVPRLRKNSIRPSTLRAEYTYVDRLTYAATRPEYPNLAYTHNGRIIGHAIGGNAKALYLRGEHHFSDKLSAIVSYTDARQSAAGNPQAGHATTSQLMLNYDLAPNKSLSVEISPYRIYPAGESKLSGTVYSVRAFHAF